VEVRAAKQLVDLEVLPPSAAPHALIQLQSIFPCLEEQVSTPVVLHVDQLGCSVADAPQEIFQLRRSE
jgi:hypothetical protein